MTSLKWVGLGIALLTCVTVAYPATADTFGSGANAFDIEFVTIGAKRGCDRSCSRATGFGSGASFLSTMVASARRSSPVFIVPASKKTRALLAYLAVQAFGFPALARPDGLLAVRGVVEPAEEEELPEEQREARAARMAADFGKALTALAQMRQDERALLRPGGHLVVYGCDDGIFDYFQARICGAFRSTGGVSPLGCPTTRGKTGT